MKRKTLIVSTIIILMILSIVSIIMIKNNTTIGNNEKISIAKLENKETENNDDDIVLKLNNHLSFAFDISDNTLRAENSDFIIIGTVNNIDGAINYNAKENLYTMTQTIGEIKINKVIKGDIKETVIPFIRLGGKIQFSEYEKSLVESQKTKLELVETLSEKEKESKYVEDKIADDISIENGKTYLMYLKYDSDYDRYGIMYIGQGLREVQTTNIEKIQAETSTELATEDIKVKNNDTGEYETLLDVVGDLNIKEN